FLREQDRRLLPAGRRDEHDRVDPAGFVETAQRLGEEWILTEPRECLRLLQPEPLPAAGRHENRPDSHAAALRAGTSPALRGRRDGLLLGRGPLLAVAPDAC